MNNYYNTNYPTISVLICVSGVILKDHGPIGAMCIWIVISCDSSLTIALCLYMYLFTMC